MKNMLLVVFTLSIEITAFSQTKVQRALEQELVIEYCHCLNEHPTPDSQTYMSESQETCLRSFLASRQQACAAILSEDKRYQTNAMTRQEKEAKLGKELIFNAVDDLITDCPQYRQTIYNYKNVLFANFKRKQTENGLARTDELAAIEEVKAMTTSITEKEKVAMLYGIIGIMYEYVNEEEEALKYYEKSLDASPTTAVKGSYELLKLDRRLRK